MWKWVETAKYRRIREAQEVLYGVAERFIEAKERERGTFEALGPEDRTLLEQYMMEDSLDKKVPHISAFIES